MYRMFSIVVFCLLLMPFNAADIIIDAIAGTTDQVASDVVIPPEDAGQIQPADEGTQKQFLEDTNPGPLDPSQLPKTIDKKEPKEANPVPVDMNPADFFTIIDKNEPKEAEPLPVDLNPADFFNIVDRSEPRETNPLPVEYPPQTLPAKSVQAGPKPDPQSADRELPRLEPKFITGTEPREEAAPGAPLNAGRIFRIIDRNEPKEENPQPVLMDPAKFTPRADRSERKQRIPAPDPPFPTSPARKDIQVDAETAPFERDAAKRPPRRSGCLRAGRNSRGPDIDRRDPHPAEPEPYSAHDHG